jgi:hypothetical protein
MVVQESFPLFRRLWVPHHIGATQESFSAETACGSEVIFSFACTVAKNSGIDRCFEGLSLSFRTLSTGIIKNWSLLKIPAQTRTSPQSMSSATLLRRRQPLRRLPKDRPSQPALLQRPLLEGPIWVEHIATCKLKIAPKAQAMPAWAARPQVMIYAQNPRWRGYL